MCACVCIHVCVCGGGGGGGGGMLFGTFSAIQLDFPGLKYSAQKLKSFRSTGLTLSALHIGKFLLGPKRMRFLFH